VIHENWDAPVVRADERVCTTDGPIAGIGDAYVCLAAALQAVVGTTVARVDPIVAFCAEDDVATAGTGEPVAPGRSDYLVALGRADRVLEAGEDIVPFSPCFAG
jgi:hypothetical protein